MPNHSAAFNHLSQNIEVGKSAEINELGTKQRQGQHQFTICRVMVINLYFINNLCKERERK